MTEETIIVGDEPNKKRTSPKTIQIQDSKTVRSKAEWLHISTSEEDGEGQGTYNVWFTCDESVNVWLIKS